ncbi:hypothetical protein [Streptomyces sp. NPDC001401]|uniref:hypothetical protein n=1 Tax=Streptomyces sp. NPDC001401 TaxID=3364570 RepID=UPI00369BCA13
MPPHDDNTPVTKTLTYRNLGTKDVTPKLSIVAREPGRSRGTRTLVPYQATFALLSPGGADSIEPMQRMGGAHPAPARTCSASMSRYRSMPMT